MQPTHYKLLTFKVLWVWICLLGTHGLKAQIKGNLIKDINLIDFPYTVTEFNSEHGLINNHAYAVVTNPDNGNLLISSTNNIQRFNGYEFDLFTPLENTKNRIFLPIFNNASQTKIYGAAGPGGFYQIYPTLTLLKEGFRFWPVEDDLLGWGDGGMVVLMKEDLSMDTLAQLPNTKFHKIFSYQDKIFLSSDKETRWLDTLNQSTLPFFEDELMNIRFDSKQQKVYFLFKNALCTYEAGALNPIDLKSPRQNLGFMDFMPLSEGILIGSRNGLLYHQNGKTLHFTMENSSMPTNIINSLYQYDENVIFACTGTSGLLKFERKKAYSYFDKSFLSKNSFGSICADEQGNLYSGSNEELFKIENGKFKIIKQFTGGISSLSLINQELHVGVWGHSLTILDTQYRIVHRALEGKTINGVYTDSKNHYWVGTNQGIFEGTSYTKLQPFLPDRLLGPFAIFKETSDGKLFIGGEKEMVLLSRDRTSIELSLSCENLNCLSFRSFLEESPGKYWIGTLGGGLILMENNQITPLLEKKGNLLSKDIFTLALDSLGNLLMSSNTGINRVSIEKLNDFIEGKIDHLIPANIGTSLGLFNSELNGFFQNNFAKLPNGDFYFPSVSGLVRIPTQNYLISVHSPVITEIEVNGQRVSPNASNFSKKTQIVKFKFAVPSFSSLENNYYQYKLVKNDVASEWSPPQKIPELEFLLLGSGQYSLYLKNLNAANAANPPFIRYDFTIEPYYYETLTFKILALLLPLILIALFIYFFLKISSEKEKYEERMSLIALEIQLSSIFTKINPHLIFNSLNALNFYISIKDSVKSTKLLDAFSKMLRQGLEENERIFIPLNKEMELIKNYLTVQKLRLDESFEFGISVDKNALESPIPNNILLPIIEYLVNQSLSQRTDKNGSISIDCKKGEKSLDISIAHNGPTPIGIDYNSNTISSIPQGLKTLKQLLTLYFYKFNVSIELHTRVLKIKGESFQVQDIKIFEND
jgi:hypothetical protein